MSYTLTSNIPYTSLSSHSSPHPSQQLDLYLPTSTDSSPSSPKALLPMIIYIHGGAFRVGDKVNPLLPLRLLSSDYALASLNYRLSGDAVFPAAIKDCKAATRYLRTHASTYGLDPEKFVVMGESAGAYMALMVGLARDVAEFEPEDQKGDDSVLGVIDFYGPTDFSQMDAHAPPKSPFKHDDPESPESLFLGVHIAAPDAKELVQKANPIGYVGSKSVPVLIAHGTGDRIVPFHQSLLLEEEMRGQKREVVLHRVEGADHVFKGIEAGQQEELDEVVDEWLKRIFGV